MSSPAGTRPEGAAPGVPYRHQTSQRSDPLDEVSQGSEHPRPDRCPNRVDEVFFDLASGEVRPARCRRNGCLYCLPVNAWVRGLAVAYVRPERMLRVSLIADQGDPDPWPTARYRWNKFLELCRRYDVSIGQAHFVVEPNPGGTGFHAQAVQHGQAKVTKTLSTNARSAPAPASRELSASGPRISWPATD